VVLIARNGKIALFDAYGFRDKEAKAPMKTDAIFRIASMTKPIVSLAAMILVEEGKLTLADAVSKHIPAFADTKVAVPKKNADGTVEMTLEPQFRPMTVQDLMRHTSGLTYGAVGSNPVKQSYEDMKVRDPNQTNAQFVRELAKLALLYQPGTHWEYSHSTDVLGRVVEVASACRSTSSSRSASPSRCAWATPASRRRPTRRTAAPVRRRKGPRTSCPTSPRSR
jgi:CubicO group peptidase (beta-lactamase class C family)